MVNDWQFTNQFFEEGREAYRKGQLIKDCPYDYLAVDHDDEKKVQNELYRQKEWLEGYHQEFRDVLETTKKNKVISL